MTRSALRKGPELFIGLVGAVGTDLELVIRFLTSSLAAVNYSTARTASPNGGGPSAPETSIRLAKLLRKLEKYEHLPTTPVDVYINEHMSAGNDFRNTTGRDDALAILAMTDIMEERTDAAEIGTLVEKTIPRRAYIMRSLKHPKELQTLREVYGDSLYLVAAYSPHDARRDYLARRIAESRAEFPPERHLEKAEALIQRDQEELGVPYGQNVRGIFHRADVFVDTTDIESLRQSANRFIELLFGNTFHTPTRDEYCMFHAQAAALRSAEPGRQVGAAIATQEGDIVAVGVNDVPKAGGGLYWCGDNPDGREFRRAQESSEDYKESNHNHIRNLLTDTFNHLRSAGWLDPKKAPTSDVNQLVDLALAGTGAVIPKSSQIRSLIEFGRAVHAEMAALSDAARRGVPVAGCTMYVTTFPCHLCARHIVAAGIRKMVYIEPYAKSRTADLYPDSIAIEQHCKEKVQFEPFVGVAPRQYMKLFSMRKRMSDDGKILLFNASEAELRYHGSSRVYLDNEDETATILRNVLIQKNLVGGD
jgi:deoxycytidylate deaminase